MRITKDKITVIGAGLVGSTSVYAMMNAGIASELVLIDVNQKRLAGEVMDLNHGSSFVPQVRVRAGDYADCADSSIIVITAGVNQKPGESRLDLLKRNVEVFRNIVPNIMRHNDFPLILVVTNPVDLLTLVTLRLSGLPPHRVIGSGTVLDSSRFRYLLSEHFNVSAQNVHAYIVGEHGDSEVPTWSLTNIAGIPIDDYCRACEKNENCVERERIFNEVKNSAYAIIEGKGATYYAVGLAVRRICEAILRNEHAILPVSSLIDGLYGIKDVALSLPTILDSQGVQKVLELPLTPEETAGLRVSADTLKSVFRDLGF